MSTAHDEYNGYSIPAGSVIIANTTYVFSMSNYDSLLTLRCSRAILHDESRYTDALSFKPERFLTSDGTRLDSSVPSPMEAFGYGRRICAGRHFAEDILFLVIANILAVFTIEKPVDQFGHTVEPRIEFSEGSLRLVFISVI